MTDRVSKTQISGFECACAIVRGEIGFGQVEQDFSSFFAKFDDCSKWSTPKALQNFKKSSNMTKRISKK